MKFLSVLPWIAFVPQILRVTNSERGYSKRDYIYKINFRDGTIQLFNTCMEHVLGWISKKLGCGVSFGTVRIIVRDFVGDAIYPRDNRSSCRGTSVTDLGSHLDCESPG